MPGLLHPLTKSGLLESSYFHMEKRGSHYLYFAPVNAAKKLVRLICAMDKSDKPYIKAASLWSPWGGDLA